MIEVIVYPQYDYSRPPQKGDTIDYRATYIIIQDRKQVQATHSPPNT